MILILLVSESGKAEDPNWWPSYPTVEYTRAPDTAEPTGYPYGIVGYYGGWQNAIDACRAAKPSNTDDCCVHWTYEYCWYGITWHARDGSSYNHPLFFYSHNNVCPVVPVMEGSGSSDASGAETSNGEQTIPEPQFFTCGGSSIDLRNGNIRHSQQVGPLTLTYNSLDTYNGPFGTGWTHDFNILIIPNADGSLFLKSGDGTLTLFTPDQNGAYHAGAQGKDSSEITKDSYGNYLRKTKYRLEYGFDPNGKLTSIKDRNGNLINITQNGSDLTITDGKTGRIVTITTSGGVTNIREQVHNNPDRTYEILHSSGLISDINDKSGKTVRNWHFEYYDHTSKIHYKRDPSLNIWTYEYYNDSTYHVYGKFKSVTYPSSDPNITITKSVTSYDSVNHKTYVTEGDGSPWIYEYYPQSYLPYKITDPFGYSTTYYYNSNVLSRVDYSADSTYESYTPISDGYTYRDRSGIETTYHFDPAPEKGGEGKRVTEIEDSTGKSSELRYDAKGNLWTFKDRTNVKTTFDRDAQGNIQYAYLNDQFNKKFEFHYLNGQVDWMKDPDGNQSTIQRSNNIVAVTDPLGHSTEYVYDNNGEDLRHILQYPGTTTLTTTFEHDSNGNISSVTDANGNPSTDFQHNYLGQLSQIKDAMGHVSKFNYSGCSSCGSEGEKITSVTLHGSSTEDAFSTTSYAYNWDTANHAYRTTINDPLGKHTEIAYYPATRKQVATDRNDEHEPVTYKYTPVGNLDYISYQDQIKVQTHYNNLGRLDWITDSLGTANFVYDDEGRIKDYTDANNFALHYEYDAVGNLSRIIYPDGQKVQYCYDNQNRLKRVLAGPDDCSVEEALYAQDQQAVYAYDAAGRLISFRNFNGITTTYGYDNANRLTKIESSVASFIFDGPNDLDANGNIKNMTETVPLTGMPAVAGQTIYGYNPQKNRLNSAGGESYDYDDEGQLFNKSIGQESTVYTFDYNHRLTGIGGATSFSYDGLGNRLSVTRGATTTRYIYDPYGNLLAEADATGITRKYIYGKGLISMATVGQNATTYCYHFNPTGSTMALTGTDQTVVNSYYYDPFGQILNQQEGFTQPFKFVGQYGVMAEPDGLYYMRARYYDSAVGRFISEDPLGFGGGDVNLFAYAGNNPVMLIDPYGLWALGDPLPQWLVDGASGFGDTLSFGGTRWVRKQMGTNGVIDNCSGAYQNGELGATALSIAFGGAHLGRNALYQMGKSGGLGARVLRGSGRLLSDGRTWNSVRDTWSLAAGNGERWLASNGQSLHHWLIPQRFSEVNAGFNYLPLSSGFNSWLNGSTAARVATEWGLRTTILGIYGAPITAGSLNGN